MTDFLIQVHRAASQRILYLPHALQQMNRRDRMISTSEVRLVIFQGVLVEDYPEDERGHSCLLLGYGTNQRPIHIVCAPKADYLAIITAYLPHPTQWERGWRTRKGD
jgi:hypothetical protein